MHSLRLGALALAGALLLPPALHAQSAVTRVSGLAYDSTARRPLAGALIQLVAPDNPNRTRSATASADGLWVIDSVPLGTYLLGMLHPRLDALNVESPLIRVDARTNEEINATIAIPSAFTLISRACGPTVAGDSLGLFTGVVRSARGTPLAGPARIRTQWVEISLGARGVERQRPSQTLTTTENGAFAFCGVPTEGTFLVRAFAGSDSSGFVELDAPGDGLLVRDIYIGGATKVPAPPSAASNIPLLRGAGTLRGVVKGATGQPVSGARLALWGSGLQDTTRANGQFEMQSLPAGTYTLEARAIGFLPQRLAVDIPEGRDGTTEFTLDPFVPTIDTVRVRADRIAAINQLSDFERRRKGAVGYFIDEAAVTKRNPVFIADLLRSTPGVTIAQNSTSRDRVLLRGVAGTCVPTVFLNGLRVFNEDGDLEQLVNPQTVRAVEIYSRTGSIPAEVQGSNGCGTIVIWTGARAPAPSPP